MKRTWSGELSTKKWVIFFKAEEEKMYGRKRYLVCSCHLLLDLLPGFVRGHKVGELLLRLLEVVVEVLLVAEVKGLRHHRIFCQLLVHAVHWDAKNLGNAILIKCTNSADSYLECFTKALTC